MRFLEEIKNRLEQQLEEHPVSDRVRLFLAVRFGASSLLEALVDFIEEKEHEQEKPQATDD